MLNKSSIYTDKIFRRYLYAYVMTQINLWMIPILTPILLNQRLGMGQEFALTLGLQWLPSVLMGPITAFLIRKWGPHKIYIAVMSYYPIIILLFPFATNLFQLQLVILGLGIGQAIASPCSITLRAYVMPEGREVAGNSIIVGTQRLAKVIGPLIAGILVALFNVETSFIICALFCIPSIIALMMIPINYPKQNFITKRRTLENIRTIVQHVCKLLFGNRLILGLLVTAIGYTITLGALRIYLFSLADSLGDEDAIYSLFLASQGFGALIGALFSQRVISTVNKRFPLSAIYAIVSIVEGLLLTLLNLYPSINFVIPILVIASIFETLAFVLYFSLLQKLIAKEDQGLYNSITMPIIDSSFLIGVMLVGSIINILSLHAVLLIAVSFTIVTVLLFFKTFMTSNSSVPSSRSAI